MFLRISFVLGGAYFALGCVSSCMAFLMSILGPARQCCEGAEISATKHLGFLYKIGTGININWVYLIFLYHFG
jgi:hypothetical protein